LLCAEGEKFVHTKSEKAPRKMEIFSSLILQASSKPIKGHYDDEE
jgi:hypothetical protein